MLWLIAMEEQKAAMRLNESEEHTLHRVAYICASESSAIMGFGLLV